MGLVIFAPTPSFACEKMRLLRTRSHTHTHGAFVHTHALGPTRATVYILFIDSCFYFFLFSLSHIYTSIIFLFLSSSLVFVIAAGLACCVTARQRGHFVGLKKITKKRKQTFITQERFTKDIQYN